MSAALNGYDDIAQELLAAGADANAATVSGQTALIVATAFGQSDCARVLVDRGAYIDTKVDTLGYTPIIFASGNCDSETVRLLLDNGADPNRETVDHMTALRLAEQRGRIEIVGLLKDYGATK